MLSMMVNVWLRAPVKLLVTTSCAPPRVTDEARSTSKLVPGDVAGDVNRVGEPTLIDNAPLTVSKPGPPCPGDTAPPVAVSGPTVPTPPRTPPVTVWELVELLPLTIGRACADRRRTGVAVRPSQEGTHGAGLDEIDTAGDGARGQRAAGDGDRGGGAQQRRSDAHDRRREGPRLGERRRVDRISRHRVPVAVERDGAERDARLVVVGRSGGQAHEESGEADAVTAHRSSRCTPVARGTPVSISCLAGPSQWCERNCAAPAFGEATATVPATTNAVSTARSRRCRRMLTLRGCGWTTCSRRLTVARCCGGCVKNWRDSVSRRHSAASASASASAGWTSRLSRCR